MFLFWLSILEVLQSLTLVFENHSSKNYNYHKAGVSLLFVPVSAMILCISMAHFNPALTVGFLITNHIERKKLLMVYLLAEILG